MVFLPDGFLNDPFVEKLASELQVGDFIVPGPRLPYALPRSGVRIKHIDDLIPSIRVLAVEWSRKTTSWDCWLAVGREQTVKVHTDIPPTPTEGS